ncbi:MAG: AMP-binding protein [Ascidiaceihabitans sp.]|nr:AMP-binding protein [Ascidiaceihabitans sp.]
MANAALYFVDRHVREGRGDKVAFREYPNGRALSYGMLAVTSDKISGAFGQGGIAQEERAAMLVLDCIEFPQIFWGAIKAGVVPVPLNTLLAAPVYDAILRDSRISILFISGALYATVKPVLADNPYLSQ